MQTIWRKIWGYSNDKEVDPATGLTGKEIRLVQSSWAILSKDPVASGVAVMLSFFEHHPEYQAVFPDFKDVPQKDLPSNKKFQAHAINVIKALDNTINALTNIGLLEATLVALGERHAKRGQTTQQFLHLKQVFMDILRKTLGNALTKETEDAWNKVFDAAYTFIFKGLSS